MKILVLVIASDDLPLYVELQKVWRCYMHNDPNVEAYFIKGDPKLTQSAIIHDVIWSPTAENPCPGIVNKTVLSLEALEHRLDEFDFILRTNLSSFFVFSRLQEHAKKLPRTGCYAGVAYPLFASGAGIIFSPDVVRLLLKNKLLLLDNIVSADDVVIGCVLDSLGISAQNTPRFDIQSIDDLPHLPADHFHFRIKHKKPEDRLKEDLPIHYQLVQKFYG